MTEGMSRLNVSILFDKNSSNIEFTHWTGSPTFEEGGLKAIDMSPTAGPPAFQYDVTGNDREQHKFTIETKLPGDSDAQAAFLALVAVGSVLTAEDVTGLPTGLDWIIESRQLTHNADGPSTLSLTIAEIGPTPSP